MDKVHFMVSVRHQARGSSRPKAAAGELVERAAKAARRKQELDPEKLFDQVIADFALEEKPAEEKGAPDTAKKFGK